MTKILITRPADDAERFAALLQARGFETFSEPILTIRATQEALVLLKEAAAAAPQALIATSRHALPLVVHCRELTARPIFVVGHETAEAARRMGFAEVTQAHAVKELLPLVIRQCSAGSGPVVYLRGRDITEDLATRLNRQGFYAQQHIVYEAEAAQALSAALMNALRGGEIGAATFLSRRTAATFMELAAKAGMVKELARVRAVTISANAAEALGGAWKSVHAAEEPTLARVAEAVDKYAVKA